MSALALASSGNALRDLDHDGTDRDFQLDSDSDSELEVASASGGPGLWRALDLRRGYEASLSPEPSE